VQQTEPQSCLALCVFDTKPPAQTLQWMPELSPASIINSVERVPLCPPGLTLVPEYLSPSVESRLATYFREEASQHWIRLSNRRVILYGLHFVSNGSGHRCYTRVIPDLIRQLAEQLVADGYQNQVANHILVNEYRVGQGIMPHEDGPAFLPNAAIISLLSGTVLDFYSKELTARSKPVASVYLPPRSLCMITEEAYTSYLHGIAERNADEGVPRSDRISLTFRYTAQLPEATREAAANEAPQAELLSHSSKEKRILQFLQRRK